MSEAVVTKGEMTAGITVVRAALEASGYSAFVTDALCERWVYDILMAAAKVRSH